MTANKPLRKPIVKPMGKKEITVDIVPSLLESIRTGALDGHLKQIAQECHKRAVTIGAAKPQSKNDDKAPVSKPSKRPTLKQSGPAQPAFQGSGYAAYLSNPAHSRACGIAAHTHGTGCHSNCPTCKGSEVWWEGQRMSIYDLLGPGSLNPMLAVDVQTADPKDAFSPDGGKTHYWKKAVKGRFIYLPDGAFDNPVYHGLLVKIVGAGDTALMIEFPKDRNLGAAVHDKKGYLKHNKVSSIYKEWYL